MILKLLYLMGQCRISQINPYLYNCITALPPNLTFWNEVQNKQIVTDCIDSLRQWAGGEQLNHHFHPEGSLMGIWCEFALNPSEFNVCEVPVYLQWDKYHPSR